MPSKGNEIVRLEKTTGLTKKELASSQLFKNIKTPAQAAVVLARAKSFNICPTIAAENLYFVNGKPAMSAQFIAIAVLKTGTYDFIVKTKTDDKCELEFLKLVDGKWQSRGVEVFTMKMANRAGLLKNPTWKTYPEAMLWARCLTAGVRARCPDALGGNPVYCVEELAPALTYDQDGNPDPDSIVDAEFVPLVSVDEIKSLIEQTETEEETFLAVYEVDYIESLSADQLADAKGKLQMKLDAQKL